MSDIIFNNADIPMGINYFHKIGKKKESLILQSAETKDFMAALQGERTWVEGGQSEAWYSTAENESLSCPEICHSAIIQQPGQFGDAVEARTLT